MFFQEFSENVHNYHTSASIMSHLIFSDIIMMCNNHQLLPSQDYKGLKHLSNVLFSALCILEVIRSLLS